MKKYGFGVDIGGTTIKMGFFETDGKLLDKWEIKTDTSNNGENILYDVAKAVEYARNLPVKQKIIEDILAGNAKRLLKMQ